MRATLGTCPEAWLRANEGRVRRVLRKPIGTAARDIPGATPLANRPAMIVMAALVDNGTPGRSGRDPGTPRGSRFRWSSGDGSSVGRNPRSGFRSEEHTSELQSLMRISYA